jgi:hypothetical protein
MRRTIIPEGRRPSWTRWATIRTSGFSCSPPHALGECYPPNEVRQPLDPEYANTIVKDECYINPKPKGISWKEMAFRAEEVMTRLHKELLAEG